MRGTFDAIVIGGGPAGALAGLLLARQGWRIAIIERGKRHRSKTCGHCLSPRALPILESAGLLDAVREVRVGGTSRLRVYSVNRAPIELVLDDSDEGLLVERSAFDQLLLDRAASCGARVYQGAHVHPPPPPRFFDFQGGGQGVGRVVACCARTRTAGGSPTPQPPPSKEGEFCAPLIIGADGLGSGVARAFGVAPLDAGRKFGFSFDLPNQGMDDPHAVNMFVTSGGYLGVVQQRDHSLHVAALIDSRGEQIPREPLAFCRAVAQQFDELKRTGAHQIMRSDVRNFTAAGPLPWRPRKIAGEGFALIGDAAGYVEPFTGEGMCWALQGAAVLAEAVRSCRPGEWNEAIAARYSALWRRRIGSAQRRCAAIAWALERPWALAMARRLAGRAMLQRVARQVVAA